MFRRGFRVPRRRTAPAITAAMRQNAGGRGQPPACTGSPPDVSETETLQKKRGLAGPAPMSPSGSPMPRKSLKKIPFFAARQGQAPTPRNSPPKRPVSPRISVDNALRGKTHYAPVRRTIFPRYRVVIVTLDSHAAGRRHGSERAADRRVSGPERQPSMPPPNGPEKPAALEEAKNRRAPMATSNSSPPSVHRGNTSTAIPATTCRRGAITCDAHDRRHFGQGGRQLHRMASGHDEARHRADLKAAEKLRRNQGTGGRSRARSR